MENMKELFDRLKDAARMALEAEEYTALQKINDALLIIQFRVWVMEKGGKRA
jgi:hypothetical protein